MSDGVQIPYEVLNELNGSLKQIIVEFDQAGDRTGALEGAIGSPLGRNGLREQVDRFEGAWNDKRETLKQDVQELQKHVDEVGQAWVNWDTEASASLSVDQDESKNLPKGN
ncbi:hypothetical protein [Agromyces italicus]|uniref:hypothetical protein n=1 Tax=Agromyces italicus TaxID=279572 RepID=UPI0003B6180A|nr:hypothetical protein [Agromyces italicus]